MSDAAIQKLHALLERVQQRRAEPRLVALPGASALSSANTNVAREDVAPVGELAPAGTSRPTGAPGTPLEEEVARYATRSDSHDPEGRRSTSSIQPAVALETQPPTTRSEPPAQLKTPTSTVPPPGGAGRSELPPRASTEVLPPTPARVVPAPALPFDAAVKVVTSPRIELPKTFGELLEASLSLRPK